MAGGANTAVLVQLAAAEVPSLFAALIGFFGRRKTGMTGEQKMNAAVDFIAPLVQPAATIVSGNTNDPAHKAEIAILGDSIHAALLANNQIAPTSVLESGAPVTLAPMPNLDVKVAPGMQPVATTVPISGTVNSGTTVSGVSTGSTGSGEVKP